MVVTFCIIVDSSYVSNIAGSGRSSVDLKYGDSVAGSQAVWGVLWLSIMEVHWLAVMGAQWLAAMGVLGLLPLASLWITSVGVSIAGISLGTMAASFGDRR